MLVDFRPSSSLPMPDTQLALAAAPEAFLPYGRQRIEDEDIAAVVEALRADYLTTGPKVGAFERAFASFCGAKEAVAVNSGTAALHAAMRAIGIKAGDEVIVPAITFAASANAVVYEGGTPVFADVEPDTLLIDAASVARKITPRTRAIVTVDYAGQPADYATLRELARAHGLYLIADACHAPGGSFKGRPVGTLGDISCFSFHPVKHLTTCEGGMCVTDDAALASHMRRFRNHGIDSDHARREQTGTFRYDMVELGYNYRLPDVQCALGLAQLRRLPDWLAARRTVADAYARAFAKVPQARPLGVRDDREHAWHLYVVRLADHLDRDRAFAALRAEGIGANVHYTPVHLLAFYRARGYGPGLCPVAEREADRVLTLPMFVGMDERDVERVAGLAARLQ